MRRCWDASGYPHRPRLSDQRVVAFECNQRHRVAYAERVLVRHLPARCSLRFLRMQCQAAVDGVGAEAPSSSACFARQHTMPWAPESFG
jgi:hypothetical protein